MTSFSVDLDALRKKPKDRGDEANEKLEEIAEERGFVERSPSKPKGKRGRPRSPRTGQVHAKVLPHFANSISDTAKIRGVQQGVVLEEAWALYCDKHGIELTES